MQYRYEFEIIPIGTLGHTPEEISVLINQMAKGRRLIQLLPGATPVAIWEKRVE